MVDALRNIHAALVPGGLLLDSQPVSRWAPVSTAAGPAGLVDLRGFQEIVSATARLVDGAIADGLFDRVTERSFVVTEGYDDGAEAIEDMRGWSGTRIPGTVERRLLRAESPVEVQQDVRLRILRALA